MTLHRIQFSVVALVLFVLLFASVVAQPAGRKAVAGAAKVKASATTTTVDWVFEGCWTQYVSGPCRDVYHDAKGNYYICRDCGTTGTPTPGKCSPISSVTLSRGFWCS